MKLTVVRHGQTEENKAEIFQGHMPGVLTDLGIFQAQKLADRLADDFFHTIYSSDLRRAVDTANIIARYHSDTPLIFAPQFRERNHGEFQGVKRSECLDYIHSDYQSKKGENNQMIYDRASQFLSELLNQHVDQNILLVGHNAINKGLISVITNDPYYAIENRSNTAVDIFEIDMDRNFKHLLKNCTIHLD